MKQRTEAVSHFVELDLDVKSWAERPPDVGTARPGRCPACGEPGCCEGRVILHGHGLRVRELRGLLDEGQAAASFALELRRFVCQRCRTVITVGPRGLLARRRYTAATIGLALWLWSVALLADAKVRARVSPIADRGESRPERWTTLRRWAAAARAGRLWRVPPLESGWGLRRSAERVARWLGSLGNSAAAEEAQVFGGAAHAH